MNDLKNIMICWSTVADCLLAILGGPHKALTALCVLILLDWLSAGIARVVKTREPFVWSTAFAGALKKLGYFVAVAVAVWVEEALDAYGFDTRGALRTAFLLMFIGTEASSALRHLGACGICVPEFVRRVLDTLKAGNLPDR
jgi:toxin secretion/phage lysis holin